MSLTGHLNTYQLAGLRWGTATVKSHRVWDNLTGLADALLFTHAHNHLLRTGLAEITDPDPPWSSPLRKADRAYRAAFNTLTDQAALAA